MAGERRHHSPHHSISSSDTTVPARWRNTPSRSPCPKASATSSVSEDNWEKQSAYPLYLLCIWAAEDKTKTLYEGSRHNKARHVGPESFS